MPTYARRQIVVEDQVGVYHCIARCVRRAFLCGLDPYTGQDYSHRKEWILDRLRELAGLFAIEVCGYSVMSNHLHLVLRIRPDIAGQWSADEIALRWCIASLHQSRLCGVCRSGRRTKGSCRSRSSTTSCCWIGPVANFARTSAGRFPSTWPQSWTGWGSINRTGWERCAASVAYSNRRPGDRGRSSMPRRDARGAGSRARMRLESPLCRSLARRTAVNRHLYYAFTPGA